MMTRMTFLTLFLGGLLAALPAFAQGDAEEIARQMAKQGFANISIEETWLGRTRIIGTRSGGSREIVLNPKTGEILRDLWLNAKGEVRAADIDFDEDGAEDGAEDAADDRLDDRLDDRADALDDARDAADDSGGNSGTGDGDRDRDDD